MRASIILAAHNEGEAPWKTVRACVETCAEVDYEILLADDASVDDSVAEAQRRFPRLRVVRHEERRGASPTKDLGAREARGDVLVFLDGHCNPEHGAIARLVQDVEEAKGNAILTPAIAGLDVQRWRNSPSQIGHGYFLDLEKFDCGWLPLSELRAVNIGRRRFYESPALIGCALAVSRELYEDLWGFDRDMRLWGVEDLDFGLKAWLMGHAILHDPEAVVGHRFRASFDNYEVPVEHTVVNQLRMARKNFTHGVWSEWLDRCRMRHPGRLHDHPEGLWARVWELFEEERVSVEQERAYLHARRVRDEFWYTERFGLTWPRLRSAPLAPSAATTTAERRMTALQPSPSPPPCKASERDNFYAGARKEVAKLEGSSAKITTNETVLDCEPTGTFTDDSIVWVGITKFVDKKATKRAQTGYWRFRVSPKKNVHKRKYFEVVAGPNKATDYKLQNGDFPTAGTHLYTGDLTAASGKWTFYYDGTDWGSWTHAGWKNETGTDLDYNGEIHHKKTQMAGKPDAKCHFTRCLYRTSGAAYIAASLVAANIFSDNKAEWGSELVGVPPTDKVNIWDKKPPFA